MKCLKKFSTGLKLSVIVVLLLLVFSPLAAWPAWLTGSKEEEQISQLQVFLEDQDQELKVQGTTIEQQYLELKVLQDQLQISKGANRGLETTVIELMQDLEKSRNNYLDSLKFIDNLKTDLLQLEIELESLVIKSTDSKDVDAVLKERIAQLNVEIQALKDDMALSDIDIATYKADLESALTLSGLSSEEYKALLNDYIPLKESYDVVVAERDQYYQDAVNANASFGGMVGLDGSLYPDGTFGAGISAGIGWGDYMLTFGVDYKIPAPFVFDLTQLTYSAGLQFKF